MSAYDRFVVDTYDLLAAGEPDGFHATVDVQRQPDCPDSSCASGGTARLGSERGQYHGLAHLITWQIDGRSIPSLEEGTAEALGPFAPLALPATAVAEIDSAFLYSDVLDGVDYTHGAVFVRFLIEEYGVDRFREFYRAMHGVRAPREQQFRERFAEVFGEPFSDAWTNFHSAPRCAFDYWYCEKATEIGIPFALGDAFTCGDKDTQGFEAPTVRPDEQPYGFQQVYRFTTTEPTAVTLTYSGAIVYVGDCGGCAERDPGLILFPGGVTFDAPASPQSVDLDLNRGTHVLIVRPTPWGPLELSLSQE